MDMNKFAGSESKYLKAADLQGKAVKVTVWRKGRAQSLDVTLGEFPEDDQLAAASPGRLRAPTPPTGGCRLMGPSRAGRPRLVPGR